MFNLCRGVVRKGGDPLSSLYPPSEKENFMSNKSEAAFMLSNLHQQFSDQGILNTTGITSRDQIINPYSLLDPSSFGNDRHGRAAYESLLAELKLIAEQQEASYQEWYNSESQQVARQRAAGLNPDLLGVEGGQASDVAAPEGSPMQGLPTDGEIAMQATNTAISGISTVLSSVSGIMGTVSQIGLNDAQKKLINNQATLAQQQSDGQFLSNIGSFISSAQSGISDMLAQSMQSTPDAFDIDGFFAGDFSSLSQSLLPSDDPRYSQAFDRVLKHSQKTLGDAYKQLDGSEDSRKAYLNKLASRYWSDDDDEMIGQLSIAVHADEELYLIANDTQKQINKAVQSYVDNIDVEAAAAGFNDENEYKSEYFGNLDGEALAVIETAIKRAKMVIDQATSDVYDYNRRQFNSPLNWFNPSRKQRIGWQIVAGSHMGWQDHFAATADKMFRPIIDEYRARIQNLRDTGAAALQNAESNTVNSQVRSAEFEFKKDKYFWNPQIFK